MNILSSCILATLSATPGSVPRRGCREDRTRLLVALTLVLGLGASVARAESIRVNFYCQTNPYWANDKMGSTKSTIGKYGCAVTCVSMALRSSPDKVNYYLSRNKGYVGDQIVWSKAADFDGSGGLKWSANGYLPGSAADLRTRIANGAVYIVRSTRVPSHFVIVFESDGSNAYYYDPIDSTATKRKVGDGWVKFGAEARIYSIR